MTIAALQKLQLGMTTLTTEKQIAANRANAKRSTGPKTLAGKRSSSGNALRHGLSKPLPAGPLTDEAIGAIACAVADGNENANEAIEFARSELDLRRIRQVRKEYLTDLAAAAGLSDTSGLRRLAALDRYERIALAKSRRARRVLTNTRPSSTTK